MKLKNLVMIAIAALPMQAMAVPVIIDGYKYTPVETVVAENSTTAVTPDWAGRAGQFYGTIDGAAFVTWCTEIGQSLVFDSVLDYTVVDGAAAWGQQRADDLSRLLSAVIASGVPVDALQAATIQAWIWEILYETSGTYDLASGTFTVVGTSATLLTINWSDVLLFEVNYRVDQLYSREYQNLLTVRGVPEPATLGLLGLGLAGIGFGARRRKA